MRISIYFSGQTLNVLVQGVQCPSRENHTGERVMKRRRMMNEVRFKSDAGECIGRELTLIALTYAFNLVGRMEMGHLLMQFVVGVLSDAGTEALLSFMLSGFTDETALKKAEARVEDLDREDEDEIAKVILGNIGTEVNGITVSALEEYLKDMLGRCIAAAEREGIKPSLSGMEDVQRLFRISADDTAFLTAVLCYHHCSPFESLCDNIGGVRKLVLLATVTDMPVHRMRQAGGLDGRLASCGLIGCPNFSHQVDFYTINQGIADYLLGVRSLHLGAKFFTVGGAGTHPLDSFNLPGSSVQILRSLLSSDRPCSVLLYGEPGTGKTEFSKALATASGKQACFVLIGKTGENDVRRTGLVAAATVFHPSDSIVVVDEADGMLNSRYAFHGAGGEGTIRKEWLNEFLDGCQAQVIWITNDISCIEESTRRRFTYAVEFKRFSARQREQIWQSHLREHPLQSVITPAMCRSLSREYQVNAAGIANALETVKLVVPGKETSGGKVEEALKDILASHENLTGHMRHGKLNGLGGEYDPDAVNASERPEIMVQSLQSFGTTGFRADQPPANLLFHGVPGTGKTAFAQYLALSLGLELMMKRASDLLSMFVGGTEHNICAAFEEAARERAILFLDEADSLFIDRHTARHSWETSQTNELLTQMENHHGILVCCTNLIDNLDLAAMRRFSWKVRFDPLTVQGKVRLFQKYFMEEGAELPPMLKSRIEQIADLTPGDIKAVSLRFRLRSGAGLDLQSVLSALEEEVVYKQRSRMVVGFAAAT